MHFARFGIVLESLAEKDLEMVRQWRNSSWVRPYMRHRGLVEPEDQAKWFADLDVKRNWYFIARVGNAPFALFHIKAIDCLQRCGESGGFVGNPEFIGRPEPAQATLALMDFAFFVLRLRCLEAQYSSQLPKIVRFNDQLGYQVFRQETDGFVRARVTADRYFNRAAAFRKAAAALHGSEAYLTGPDPWLARRLEAARMARIPDFRLQLH